MTVAIIGVGLIGGSMAIALKEKAHCDFLVQKEKKHHYE